MKQTVPTLLRLTQSFFQQYLQQTRGASPHTVRAYRDTLRLFFEFLAQQAHRGIDRLMLSDVTVQQILDFLVHLETQRGNRPVTRNSRLAALRSWVKHLLRHDPGSAEQYARVLALPAKRCPQAPPDYLEPEQFRWVLDEASPHTPGGLRAAALLLFLYNTGARISEILNLRVRDVLGSEGREVQLQGKGRKCRRIPLWPKTRRCVRQWIRRNGLSPEAPLLANRFGQPLTRSGAAKQLQQLIERAQRTLPSLRQRRISPHQFRHATAMHLLESGVPIEVIALWLGHESPNTAHAYVEASVAMKRRALASLQPPKSKRQRPPLSDSLLRFLDTL